MMRVVTWHEHLVDGDDAKEILFMAKHQDGDRLPPSGTGTTDKMRRSLRFHSVPFGRCYWCCENDIGLEKIVEMIFLQEVRRTLSTCREVVHWP